MFRDEQDVVLTQMGDATDKGFRLHLAILRGREMLVGSLDVDTGGCALVFERPGQEPDGCGSF